MAAGNRQLVGKMRCGSVPLCLRVSVLIPQRRGGAALFSTQRPRGTETPRRPEEVTTEYTEYTEWGATALCLCVSLLIPAAQGSLFCVFCVFRGLDP